MEEQLPEEQIKKEDFKKKALEIYKRHKLFVIAGAIFIFLVVILLAFYSLSHKILTNNPYTQNQQTYYASLLFDTTSIFPVDKKLESANIILDAGATPVGIVDFTITFDPKVIDSFDIRQELDPTSALSNSFDMKDTVVMLKDGFAKTTFLVKPQAAEQIGKGKIATIYFTVNPDFVGSSNISIINTSLNSKTIIGKGRFFPQTNYIVLTRSK